MQSSSERPIITLLSDYGSLYPAQMKGAILSRTRDAVLVDIAYDVPPQDVRAGAFALMAAARHFPAGTVHPSPSSTPASGRIGSGSSSMAGATSSSAPTTAFISRRQGPWGSRWPG
jgi:hypothetical protein